MSKVEEAAYKAYPYDGDYRGQGDSNSKFREAYINGYHQAEKDLELTWEDIAGILDATDVIANDDAMEERLKTMSDEEYYQEVLERFKERKGGEV